MKIRSLGYCIRQGFKNIWRNRMFSVASITTMTACILLFGMFFSVLMNVNFMIRTLEEEVGVTVLFDEGLEQDKIDEIGEKIRAMEHVTDVTHPLRKHGRSSSRNTSRETRSMPRAFPRTVRTRSLIQPATPSE